MGKEPACDAGDMGSIPGSGRSPGGRQGNPLQYSCLESPMDRGAWWATVHGVAESRTRLKWPGKQDLLLPLCAFGQHIPQMFDRCSRKAAPGSPACFQPLPSRPPCTSRAACSCGSWTDETLSNRDPCLPSPESTRKNRKHFKQKK